MTAIRKERKIIDDISLIEIKTCGVPNIIAFFLIESEKICIIDGRIHTEALKFNIF